MHVGTPKLSSMSTSVYIALSVILVLVQDRSKLFYKLKDSIMFYIYMYINFIAVPHGALFVCNRIIAYIFSRLIAMLY